MPEASRDRSSGTFAKNIPLITSILIFFAICFAAYATYRFIQSFRSPKASLGKRFFVWIRDVLDAFWGAG